VKGWKVFLISFFAVFLVPISSAFAFAPDGDMEIQPGERVIFKCGSPCAMDETAVEFYVFGADVKWRKFDVNTGQQLYPSSGWAVQSAGWGDSFYATVNSSSAFEVWNDSGVVVTMSYDIESSVIFEKKTEPIQAVKEIPKVMIQTLKDGGLLLVVLTGFGILLAVGLIPRLKSWFLRSS
jgi:hypothetical protein